MSEPRIRDVYALALAQLSQPHTSGVYGRDIRLHGRSQRCVLFPERMWVAQVDPEFGQRVIAGIRAIPAQEGDRR